MFEPLKFYCGNCYRLNVIKEGKKAQYLRAFLLQVQQKNCKDQNYSEPRDVSRIFLWKQVRVIFFIFLLLKNALKRP